MITMDMIGKVRRIGRQFEQIDIVRRLERIAAVPTGTIEAPSSVQANAPGSAARAPRTAGGASMAAICCFSPASGRLQKGPEGPFAHGCDGLSHTSKAFTRRT